jgi:hypothetical protein
MLLLLAFQLSPGQTPTIKGNVKTSIYRGIIECDFTVTDYPLIKDYIIILNKGLNIRYLRNIEDDYNYAFD